MGGEFDLIKTYLAPLAPAGAPAFGLLDDAAHLSSGMKNPVISTDTMVEGVHFFADDDRATVCRKLLRVSLSDLAAKGAAPRGYFLNMAFPTEVAEAWFRAAHDGLGHDQGEFDVALWGGDSTRTDGPAVLTITALGEGPDNPILRGGGAAGDTLFLTGPIGDAALALALRAAGGAVPEPLERARTLPNPRLDYRETLRAATSAIDISDGFVADIGKLLAEGVGVDIAVCDIPLSADARRLIENDGGLLMAALTGGDDYQVLFTAPAGGGGDATALGVLRAGPVTISHNGAPLDIDNAGFEHF